MVASASFRPSCSRAAGTAQSATNDLVEQLASRALTHGQRKVRLQRDEKGRIVGAGQRGRRGPGARRRHRWRCQIRPPAALLQPRDTTTIAAFLRTRVYRPSPWSGCRAIRPCSAGGRRTRSPASTPSPTTSRSKSERPRRSCSDDGSTNSGKRYGRGELEPRRKELLDAPDAGMVWEPGEETWENKLAVFRPTGRQPDTSHPGKTPYGARAKRRSRVGQHITNLRRKSGLGKNPERAAERAAQLTAIDEDWNCPWPPTGNATTGSSPNSPPTNPGGRLPDIAPGVPMDGDDIGKWLQQQRKPSAWALLLPEQQERLTTLGVQPDQAPPPPRRRHVRRRARARPRRRSSGAWQPSHSGSEREGDRPVPRGH